MNPAAAPDPPALPAAPSAPIAARFDALLLYRLSRLLSVAGSMVIRLCEGRFGITRREWRLIGTLASQGVLGPSQLAEHAQLDRARTSKTVGSLVTKGLVLRTATPGDRRQAVLQLSPQGEALYAELFPLVAQINAEVQACLPAPTAAHFDAALAAMQTQAEQMVEHADLPKANRRRGKAVSDR